MFQKIILPRHSQIKMLSADFRNYSLWNGQNSFPDNARLILQKAINKAHHLNKPIRFWAAPDNATTWATLIHLGVDYINTDKIAELSQFIKNVSKYR